MEAVILTKSYKDGGWCVVAYDISGNKLVRFVSNNGAAIPKWALDSKNIGEMDRVTVRIIRECPCSPQTENLQVDLNSFERLGPYTPGIGKITRMLPDYPADEPLFMNDCRYKYDDVSQFHHSIEIMEISDLYIYTEVNPFSGQLKRACKFRSHSGANLYMRITTDYYHPENEDTPIEFESAYAIMTIPMNAYIPNGSNEKMYFKFVAALYDVPPTLEEENHFVELTRREPLAHPHYVQDALAIPHNKNAEVYVAQIDEEVKSYKEFYNNLLWRTKKTREEKRRLLEERYRLYCNRIIELRRKIEEVIGINA